MVKIVTDSSGWSLTFRSVHLSVCKLSLLKLLLPKSAQFRPKYSNNNELLSVNPLYRPFANKSFGLLKAVGTSSSCCVQETSAEVCWVAKSYLLVLTIWATGIVFIGMVLTMITILACLIKEKKVAMHVKPALCCY